MDDPVRLLLCFIMPLWYLVGFADYLCHRATGIARISEWKEFVRHFVMFAEMAVPLLTCLFFEVNALVFAVMFVTFLLHEATALGRNVTPIERTYTASSR